MFKKKSKKDPLFCGRFKVFETYTGGMATVLACQDVHNGRIVAAKAPHFAPELFSREARMWLGLGEHPNIVKAHLVHNNENVPYLFMNFIGGENDESQTFRQALLRTPNRYKLILNTGIGVVHALEYARSIYPGFVHRDIKPENILIDNSENVYLSDFGIGHIPRAGLAEDNNKEKLQNVTGLTICTKTGGFVGTFGYASPEQYMDSSIVSFKSDIYSLGIVLFEALYCTLPYDPKLIAKYGYPYLQKTVKIKDNLSSDMAKVLKALIFRMINPSAKDRPASLESLKQEFITIKREHDRSETKNEKPTDSATINGDEATYVNRIYSFIELGEHELAISNISKFQKKFPLSQNVKRMVHKLFQRMPDDVSWDFIRNVTINDISSFKWTMVAILVLFFTIGPFIFLQTTAGLPMSFVLPSVLLLFVLHIERYINSRTSITLDKITLIGIVVGIALSFVLSIFHLQSTTGGTVKSLAGMFIGLAVLLSIAWIYTLITGKDGVGGGTIKLSAMIGSWTGLLIMPILVVAILILAFQGLLHALINALPGDLRWDQDTLVPRLIKKISIAVPTSTSFLCATWLVLLYAGIKLLKPEFLNEIDVLMVRFLP